MWDAFRRLGWQTLPRDQSVLDWTSCVRTWVDAKLIAKQFSPSQLRCGGTWFAGVNFLENKGSGEFNGISFSGHSVAEILKQFGVYFDGWDSAQVSICYPGYPKKMNEESTAAFEYRKKRYGAHVDGIIPVGINKRRFLKEPHAFVLGIPLSDFNKYAAPLVVWEGSHKIIRSMIWEKLKNFDPQSWTNIDITENYHEARRIIFNTCKPKIITAPVGSTYIIHRHSLHGIMPWDKRGDSEASGRMIAYFRPKLKKLEYWLESQI